MSAADTVQSMIDTLTAIQADAAKHDGGNNAAGTRVRKAAQAVAGQCKDLRKQVIEDRNNR